MTVADFPVAKSTFTPDDLLMLEGGDELFELVDGKLVEKKMSAASGEVVVMIVTELQLFLRVSPIARVTTEATFACFESRPSTVRRPDAAVVLSSRIEPKLWAEGHMTIPPDIAIESLSPGNTVLDVDDKIDDYRSAGVRLVWVLKPERRAAHVYRLDGSEIPLREDDTLTGENILPGFSVRVGDLFPPKARPA